MVWIARQHRIDPRPNAVIMGILNVTPDSFSDAGRHATIDAALAHGRAMIDRGARIVDVGGESTRPGADPVPVEEELRRVIPVIRGLAADGRVILSIDTMKAAVARAALDAGASIINDVSALDADPEMADVARDSGAGVVLMHMRGTPRTMQDSPTYTDAPAEIRTELAARLAHAIARGIDPARVALDPGIGFSKTAQHNLEILARLDTMRVEGRPLVIGFSKKSFLARVTGRAGMEARFWPTVALVSYARERGADVLRVHDPRECGAALRVTEAILQNRRIGS